MPVRIFLAVNVKTGKAKKVQSMLRDCEEVVLACTVSNGPYEVVAIVDIESLDNYKSFSIDKVGSLPDVDDYTSFITID
ncbi:MAG: Lrp/AsnC ligand binding domain-containing protein [Candidatus Thorarchaeota archaeon]